jgi:hypothetical protein
VTGQIVDWALDASPEWGSWRPGRGPDEADGVAARLSDGDAARALVREAVLAFDAEDHPGAVLTSALWVPDRTTGQPYGVLRVELLVDAPGEHTSAESFAADARRPARRRGYKVFHQDVATTEVDAGPAVIATVTYAEKQTRQVVTVVRWTVFPPGADEAVQLEFSTPLAEVAEALAQQSIAVVNTLRVTLGETV